MAAKDKCGTCVYRSDIMYLNRCDYLSITGHSRGCAGDEHCERYQKGPRKRRKTQLPAAAPALSRGEADLIDYLKSSRGKPCKRYSLERSLSRHKQDQ